MIAPTDLAALLAHHEMRQRLLYPEGRQARWTLVYLCGDWVTDYEFDDRSEEQQDAFRAHLAAVITDAGWEKRAEVLIEAANKIEGELICCDAFERGDSTHRHQICFWGGAARRLVLDLIYPVRGEVSDERQGTVPAEGDPGRGDA